MSTVDQFESVFKAAAKSTYLHETRISKKFSWLPIWTSPMACLYLNSVRQFFEKSILPEET